MWHFFSRSKVHGRVQSLVEFLYPLLHTALFLCPPSLHSLILHSWSPKSLPLQPLLAVYLVSGRPSVAAVAEICGELFNSSQSFNRIFPAKITGARYPNGSNKHATVDSIERLVNIGLRQNLKLRPKPSLFGCQHNAKVLMESLLSISKMLLLERSVVGLLSKISGLQSCDEIISSF